MEVSVTILWGFSRITKTSYSKLKWTSGVRSESSFCPDLKASDNQRQPNILTIVGGYSAAALQAGVGSGNYSSFSGGGSGPPSVTRRYHAYQAAFSQRTAVGQIDEFLCGP